MATATHRPRPQKTEEPGDGPTRQEQQTRQSLRLIAESLGMSVESFYASVRPAPGGELSPPVSPAQQLSIDSAELLQAFMTLSEPSDRRLCIAFIQKLAAKQGT